MELKRGIVYLVGAGPGEPDLMTVKARQIVEQADVIMHDTVVSKEILALAGRAKLDDAELRGYANRAHQKELAQRLAAYVNPDAIVCRLKSGDPFMFGNGAETLHYLHELGIEVEIVPGISSGLGAASRAGVALTHGATNATLCMVGGYRGQSERLNYKALASMGTVVLYMALGLIGEHVRSLLQAGMAPDKSACIIERGTHADERVFYCTLAEIENVVKANGVSEPAIVILGGQAAVERALMVDVPESQA